MRDFARLGGTRILVLLNKGTQVKILDTAAFCRGAVSGEPWPFLRKQVTGASWEGETKARAE
jgi:hypothetical protein